MMPEIEIEGMAYDSLYIIPCKLQLARCFTSIDQRSISVEALYRFET